jgi:hypothetical protein
VIKQKNAPDIMKPLKKKVLTFSIVDIGAFSPSAGFAFLFLS